MERKLMMICQRDDQFTYRLFRKPRRGRAHNWNQQPLVYVISGYVSAQLSCFIIARFLYSFCELIYNRSEVSYLNCLIFEDHAQYLHFHGEAHARLERDNSVYGYATNERTMFIKMTAPFLFWAPYVHHQALQKMWVDGVMHKSVWEESMKKLDEEWQDLVLLVRFSLLI